MLKPASWVLATALIAFAVPAGAQQITTGSGTSARASDISAQQRPPTRLRVTPLRRAPLDRRAYRQCEDWLATEYRQSGTVIVPKMRCWWVRG